MQKSIALSNYSYYILNRYTREVYLVIFNAFLFFADLLFVERILISMLFLFFMKFNVPSVEVNYLLLKKISYYERNIRS